jgi:hypothetical protein
VGHKVAPSTVWQILKDAGIDPSPTRLGQSWRSFLALACRQAHVRDVQGGNLGYARPGEQEQQRDGAVEGAGAHRAQVPELRPLR